MPCFKPLQGWRSKIVNPSTGKRSIVFRADEALRYTDKDSYVTLPCGSCIGCRISRTRQWAIRCVHEASLYQKNCFITLTYNDAHLPANGSIDPEAPVLFMKRLRKKYGAGIRSFGCAEYGEKFQRPHYHLLIFNHDFADKKLVYSNGKKMFRSAELDALWSDPVTGESYGYSTVDNVNFSSSSYVAGYVTKKITGKKAVDYYGDREPERSVCVSRGSKKLGTGGIGKGWLDKYTADVYPSDSVVIKGKELPPPRFYDKHFELVYPSDFAKLKIKRTVKQRLSMKDHPEENSPRRLHDRMVVAELNFKKRQRSYENET